MKKGYHDSGKYKILKHETDSTWEFWCILQLEIFSQCAETFVLAIYDSNVVLNNKAYQWEQIINNSWAVYRNMCIIYLEKYV